jgi:orotate phosphoribosyltransferase-like protein
VKDINLKEKFIQLRAKGFSFDKIANEISTSKPTLLKWSEEFEDEVANLAYLETESLIEQYQLAKLRKIEAFSLVLYKALEEFKRRDFSEVATKDLLPIISSLESKLKIELTPIEYQTDQPQDFFAEGDILPKRKTLPLLY